MMLKCDVCYLQLTEAQAEMQWLTVGDSCYLCEQNGNDGIFECSYEDEPT